MDQRTDQAKKAEALRVLHRGPRILILPNAWDVASAAVFAECGFPATATTSAGIAFSLGYPDGQHIPREEMLSIVARIVARVPLPLTADLEAGYGRQPEDVAKTVRELVAAGGVGMNLEDADGDDRLFELPLQLERIRAAYEASRAAGVRIVLNARTDAYLSRAIDPQRKLGEALKRASAYRRAGADCLFVPGVTDAGAIGTLVDEVDGPLNILAGSNVPPIAELERLGVARVSIGSGAMRSTLGLVRRIGQELLRAGSYRALSEDALPYAEVNKLFGRK